MRSVSLKMGLCLCNKHTPISPVGTPVLVNPTSLAELETENQPRQCDAIKKKVVTKDKRERAELPVLISKSLDKNSLLVSERHEFILAAVAELCIARSGNADTKP